MSFWHYLAAPFALALLGALWHLARGLWAPLPERITGTPWLDVYLPLGYRWTDFIHDVEFDEDGFYELHSRRNLKVAVGLAVGFGMPSVVCIPPAGDAMAFCLDWFAALVVRRWDEL